MSPELSGQNQPDRTTSEYLSGDQAITWDNLGDQLAWTDQGVVERAQSDSDIVDPSKTESPEDLSPVTVESMAADAEANGYHPQRFGEQTVLSINDDGKVRIESQYRALWQNAAEKDPDFYNNSANTDFSVALWKLGNSAMIQDLNPEHTPDKAAFPEIYNLCIELKSHAQNPEYSQRIDSFLDQLDDLGTSGASIVAIYDIAGDQPLTSPETSSIDPDLATELQRKQTIYNQLEQRYHEVISAPALDSDDLANLAKAYHDLGDFVDSEERFTDIQNLLDRLGAITSTFD